MRRTLCIALSALALAGGAVAQDAPASTAEIYACAQTADDSARLACYDAAVGRLKAAEDAGEIATVTREEVETVQRDSFGFSIPSLPAIAMPRLGGGEAEEVERVTFAVDRITVNRLDKATIYLDNGQVWRQTDGRRQSTRGIEEAEIFRAALGSFRMKLDGGTAFRVTRVR